MPKRVKTPPPGDDEPKYLVVHQPYPLHANMELHQDVIKFVFWQACIFGKDRIYSFFHKPSAPQMVIVEIDRNFEPFDHVLGAHKWSEFLLNPSPEEIDRVSRIFYCKLTTHRDVQKLGWKKIDIQETWFHKPVKFNPNNRFITFPYPQSSYCETPVEDQTNRPLCCPLPVRAFVPPPPKPAPPVGSAAWLAERARGGTEKSSSDRTRTRTRAGPTLPSDQTSSGRAPSRSPVRPGTAWPIVSAGTGTAAASGKVAWSTVAKASNVSYAPSMVSAASGSSQGSQASRGSGSGSQVTPISPITPVEEVELVHEVGIATYDTKDSLNDGIWPSAASVVITDGMSDLKLEYDETQTVGSSEFGSQAGVEDGENYASFWEERDAEKFDAETDDIEAALCDVHGITCKKGICKEFKKQMSKVRALQREKERAEARALGKKKGGKGKEVAKPSGPPPLAFQPDRSDPQRASQKEWKKIHEMKRMLSQDAPSTGAVAPAAPASAATKTVQLGSRTHQTGPRQSAWGKGAPLVGSAAIMTNPASADPAPSPGPATAIEFAPQPAVAAPASENGAGNENDAWATAKSGKKRGKANTAAARSSAWETASTASDPWASKGSGGDGWDAQSAASSGTKKSAASSHGWGTAAPGHW